MEGTIRSVRRAHVTHRAHCARYNLWLVVGFDRSLECRQHFGDVDIVPVPLPERRQALIRAGAGCFDPAHEFIAPGAILRQIGFRPRLVAEVIAKIAIVEEDADVVRIAAIVGAWCSFGSNASGNRCRSDGWHCYFRSTRSQYDDSQFAGDNREGEPSPHGRRTRPSWC